MPQLICDRLNGVRTTRTILAAALRTLDRDASPLEHTVAGSCRLLTAGRWPEETRGRSRWTKGQRPWRPGDTAESVKGDGLRRHEGDHGGRKASGRGGQAIPLSQ